MTPTPTTPTTPDPTPTQVQVLELVAELLEAIAERRQAWPKAGEADFSKYHAAVDKYEAAEARLAALDTDLIRAQAIEQEGVEAGLQGCVGTHNPYLFADEVKREAWERGNKRVRDLLERSHQAAALAEREAEVERLRAALEFYADENNLHSLEGNAHMRLIDGGPFRTYDRGFTARQALTPTQEAQQ
ncbi:hypothetical protein ACINK0_11465 [Deinococcus sp. VB343]|uniref:ribosome modulation factor n=1 Tax=Deinococcus sp. VB343 TaxID=3385567 RepID=UPI0039C98226